MSGTAADIARAAAALAAAGQDAEAAARFDEGLARYPRDARLANSAGNFHARARRDRQALALFERALVLDPALGEAAVNAAIVAMRLDRPALAEAALAGAMPALSNNAQAWTLRAQSARARGDFGAADDFLSTALAIDAAFPAALRSRTRLALERGDADAVERHEQALLREPGDRALMEGYILALQAAGRVAEALDFATALTAHFPAWIEGQAALADLRWAAGDSAYADGFAAAATAQPQAELYLAWAASLSGADRYHEAADVLRQGLAVSPDDPRLLLGLAVALGEAGEPEAAEAILTAPFETAEWELARARNALRLGRPDSAATRLEPIARGDLSDVTAWALLDCAWRLLDDPRHGWLHGRPELVRTLPLPLGELEREELCEVLRGLHRASAVPLAQSVKRGTQTRGALFARREPVLARLKQALGEVLADYRNGLPNADPTHPLLARRETPWSIVGSWSVRFLGRGQHAAHIHPRGLLSSACYLVVPDEINAEQEPGWLELGRPPEGLGQGLEPLRTIRPEPGLVALFPSTLFHGTRAIAAGERMTVAFDVAAEPT